jgi:hypothetical protein
MRRQHDIFDDGFGAGPSFEGHFGPAAGDLAP